MAGGAESSLRGALRRADRGAARRGPDLERRKSAPTPWPTCKASGAQIEKKTPNRGAAGAGRWARGRRLDRGHHRI